MKFEVLTEVLVRIQVFWKFRFFLRVSNSLIRDTEILESLDV